VGFIRRIPELALNRHHLDPAPLKSVVNEITFDYVLISEPEIYRKKVRATAVLWRK